VPGFGDTAGGGGGVVAAARCCCGGVGVAEILGRSAEPDEPEFAGGGGGGGGGVGVVGVGPDGVGVDGGGGDALRDGRTRNSEWLASRIRSCIDRSSVQYSPIPLPVTAPLIVDVDDVPEDISLLRCLSPLFFFSTRATHTRDASTPFFLSFFFSNFFLVCSFFMCASVVE
jgi:hypothetical protein